MDLGLRVALVTRAQQLAGGSVAQAWEHIGETVQQHGLPTEDTLRDWLAEFDAPLDALVAV